MASSPFSRCSILSKLTGSERRWKIGDRRWSGLHLSPPTSIFLFTCATSLNGLLANRRLNRSDLRATKSLMAYKMKRLDWWKLCPEHPSVIFFVRPERCSLERETVWKQILNYAGSAEQRYRPSAW